MIAWVDVSHTRRMERFWPKPTAKGVKKSCILHLTSEDCGSYRFKSGGSNAIHTTGPHGLESKPPVPGHDEFRTADDGSRQPRNHGSRAGTGHQLLRYRECLRRKKGRGRH